MSVFPLKPHPKPPPPPPPPKPKTPRVLFILKQRGYPYQHDNPHESDWAAYNWTGLANSVRYVVDMLNSNGIEAKYVVVVDNNSIDREVTAYRPTHCVIEALWVVPSKFQILTKLHPTVKWNVRLHSEIPFIAQEGIAMEWIFDYFNFFPKVAVSSNSLRMQATLTDLLGPSRPVAYTPNYYPISELKSLDLKPDNSPLDIGCYGAIRPLKNQLIQAVAAIIFANQLGKTLRFHINGVRIEMGGSPVLNNLVALFAHSAPHQLVIDGWMNIDEFTKLVRTMDIGMQVSFSETFNIVSADFAANDIPLVVSPEVSWANYQFQADPSDVYDIISKLHVAWAGRRCNLQKLNKQGLKRYDGNSVDAWKIFLSH